MTKDEAIELIELAKAEIEWEYSLEYQVAFDMAIKALEQCEVWNGIHGQVVAPKGTFDRIWEDADKADQEPTIGHWSHDGSHWKNRWICSECGYKLFDEQTRFCPNCGAKMESEAEE